jgi:molecular chaperone DnaK (HSP70)
MSDSRYSIGIDLGTTHCALSYVDLAGSDGEKTTLEVQPITQLTAPATIDNLPLLPSFLYLPHPSELAPFDLGLPWTGGRDFAVGEMARSRGAATPIRLVSSAKSWLCHPGVDRRAAILPNDAPPEVALQRAGNHRHDSRLVRSGCPRTDRRSRAARRLYRHDVAGGTAGGAL